MERVVVWFSLKIISGSVICFDRNVIKLTQLSCNNFFAGIELCNLASCSERTSKI
jgi:hypothetical protein